LQKIDFHRAGTLRLATNAQRVEEFKLYTARDYYRQGDSCRTQLIDAARARELCPLLNAEKVCRARAALPNTHLLQVLAALYTTGDGYIDSVGLARAFAVGARTAGAAVLENCAARAIERDGDFWAIATDMGTIRTKHVVNAAGMHGHSLNSTC
jgi:glycine/D-amino acid oxidase-like deaminating enzyme